MKYKITVIMAVYNVEKYLEESIESIINQDIGFNNIQLILVNDGSLDNSDNICLKYKKKYPHNILYLKQENKGVSSARNLGLKYIQGEYVNFCDSDDLLSKDVCSKVYNFFESHKKEIDLVSIRLKFFGAREGFDHPLDFKYTKNRLIDLNSEYNYIQMSASTSFFKYDSVKNRKFDENLKYAEDAKLVNQILMNKLKYGVVSDAVYNYRKRFETNSALDSSSTNYEWYFNTLNAYHLNLIAEAKEKFNYIPSYIQFAVMYDLQFRIKNAKTKEFLNNNDSIKYKKVLSSILKNIDDKIIIEQKNISINYKLFILELKYQEKIKLELIKNALFYRGTRVCSATNNKFFQIVILNIDNNCLILEGIINKPLLKNHLDFYIEDDKNKKYLVEKTKMFYRNQIAFNGENVNECYGFKISIPLDNIKYLNIKIEIDKLYKVNLNLNFGKFAKLNSFMKSSYYIKNNYLIRKRNKRINVYKNKGKYFKIKRELSYYKELIKHVKFNIIFLRMIYFLSKIFYQKKIWIISDRSTEAKDNGAALFKYINKSKMNLRDIQVYFALSKKSTDYCEIKKYGKVINYGSFKHKIFNLLSDKIISSHADDIVLNLIGDDNKYLSDLHNYHFVFLQHGIIMNDFSSWLNKYNKNINLFLTTSKDEYKSITSKKFRYEYNSDVVKLTGMPRYDLLKNNNSKKIILLPTWRVKIAGEYDSKTNTRLYNDKFKHSDYFKYYNEFLNSSDLAEFLTKHNYVLEFYLHPAHIEQIVDFNTKYNNVIRIIKTSANYNKIISNSNILITDYSSVALDFSYLKKPIIYNQFDSDNFFNDHTLKSGYFSYEKNGHGPITKTPKDTIDEIKKIINRNCKLEKKYEKRINSFFEYFDKNNSKRILKEIINLDKKK